MFKKTVKRCMAVLLTLVLLLTSLPLTAFAEITTASTAATEVEDEYIYYSDLFYGYSYFLNDREFLSNHNEAQGAMNTAFDQYIDSPQFTWAAISKHISLTTSMSDLMIAYSDMLGLTNVSYNDNLDEANKKFAQSLFELKVGDIEGISKDTKCIGQFKKIISTLQKVWKAIYDTQDIKTYDTFVDLAYADMQEYCKNLKPLLPSLKSGTYTAMSELLSVADDTQEVLDLFTALIVSLGMEEIRLDIIKEIIETQESDTILYEGMNRLYSQLKNEFVRYFIDTYFTDKLIDEVSKKAAKYITSSIMKEVAEGVGVSSAKTLTSVFGAVTASVGLINTIVFNWILGDYIPSIEDYQVTMILAQYSNLMKDSVSTKQAVFRQQFETEEIEKYETLMSAYAASMRCALDECASLVSPINNDTKESINDLKLNFDNNFYADYVNRVKESVSNIASDTRVATDFGTWTLSDDTTLSGASDIINADYLYFPRCGLKANINKGHDSKFYGMKVLDDQYIKLCGSFDVQFNNKYSESNATLTIPENTVFEIEGDFKFACSSFSGSSGTSAYLINYGELNVLGDVQIAGSYSYYFGGSQAAKSYNYGIFRVTGNMTLDVIADEFKNEGEIYCGGLLTLQGMGVLNNNNFIKTNDFYLGDAVDMPYSDFCFNMDKKDATIIISGNFKNDYENSRFDSGWMLSQVSGKRRCNVVNGTVVFAGNQQQEVGGLSATNIRVTNPCGIKYVSNNYLYGKYELNGYPLDANGYRTYIYNGSSFDRFSNYKELYVEYQCSLSLPSYICADIYGAESAVLSVEEGKESVIYGSLNLSRWARIENYGNLFIYNSVTCGGLSNKGTAVIGENLIIDSPYRDSYWGFCTEDSQARLTIGKNATVNYTRKASGGSLVFNGKGGQIVSMINAPTIVLENESEEGVVFESYLSPSVLFNHNGNKFTLKSGGIFVDYDGDGMKDNVDPEPTVSNCIVHIYDNDCDAICNVCEDVRMPSEHIYSHACDTSCNVCDNIRIASEHVYDNSCDVNCNVCGDTRNITHTYDNACDTTCDCGYVRTITHTHQPAFDAHNHFEKCTVCGDVINVKLHEFDNACDTTCDCGYVRTITHTHQSAFDTQNHFEQCTVCGDVINAKPHAFANACDATCDCGFIRTFPAHIYDNGCDKDCNVCGTTRITEHKYDNACDKTCNNCGASRTAPHSFGDYIYNDDATCTADGTKTRTCSLCKQGETITAFGTKLVDSSKLFTDVIESSWYKTYIDYAVTYRLMNGTGDGQMAPERAITRAEFVQLLANLSGIDTSNKNVSTNFMDVKSGEWFAPAVKWAYENGLVNGMSATEFAPNDQITREQMCTLLVRYIEKYLHMTLKNTTAQNTFADDAQISSWAKESVYKCQMAGLVSGVSATEFAPLDSANRAAIATIMTRFHKQYL